MRWFLLPIVALGFVVVPASAQKKPKVPPVAPVGEIDYVRDIQPIFATHCTSCHGVDKQKGGLRLDGADLVLQGGNSGKIVAPGDSAKSKLIRVLNGSDPEVKMPEGGKPLAAAQIEKLKDWIDLGAKTPQAGDLQEVRVQSDHWAFKMPVRPEVPKLKDQSWSHNEIDHFILGQMERRDVKPSPAADRSTLLRRVYLDLTGLPPSADEVEFFLNDSRPDAYEQLVSRLLQSPHYGERWGRHWLDMARYADSDGYEKDSPRPHAWRYRHWVIEALNRDLPFDQFAIEQLAGDLLPNATPDQKTATGFHRNTLTNREGGVDQEQFRVEAVVDRVNTTYKVFLGLTMNCSQCHDHKYDPLSQREYYQTFAFFNSDQEVLVPAPIPSYEADYQKKMVVWEKRKAELQASEERVRQAWEAEVKSGKQPTLADSLKAIAVLPEEKRDAKQTRDLVDYLTKTLPKYADAAKALADHEKQAPKPGLAQAMALGPARKTHVLIRGDFLRPGAEVSARTPAVLPNRAKGTSRLDFARWIADPENPLTARVAVNWIWQRYFGRGIVPTLEDFGTQGEKPSNPELLDWLATEFVRQGYSLKKLHKLIVTSATYRQASRARPELRDRDPNNLWLARQNRLRLEAEIVRDEFLAVSGLLNRSVGGPSVRPPQPTGISELTYAGSAKWAESTGPDRYRRGIYTWFQRTSPYPMLMMFDAPESNICQVRRDRSNTPLQALTMLNDVVFVECAQALGRKLAASAGTNEERIALAYRLCLARDPSDLERSRIQELYEEFRKLTSADEASAARLAGANPPAKLDETAAWVLVARTLLNLDEFITRE